MNGRPWIGLMMILVALFSLWLLTESWRGVGRATTTVAVAPASSIADEESSVLVNPDIPGGDRQVIDGGATDLPAEVEHIAGDDAALDFEIQLVELRQSGATGASVERVPYRGPGSARLSVLGANQISTTSTESIVAGFLTISLPDLDSSGVGALVSIDGLVLDGQPYLPVSVAVLPLDGSVKELLVRASPTLVVRVVDDDTGVALDRFQASWSEGITPLGVKQRQNLSNSLLKGAGRTRVQLTNYVADQYRGNRLVRPDDIGDTALQTFQNPATMRLPSYVASTLWVTAPGYSWGMWAPEVVPSGDLFEAEIRIHRAGNATVCVRESESSASLEVAVLWQRMHRLVALYPIASDGCEQLTLPAGNYIAVLRSTEGELPEVYDRVGFTVESDGFADVMLHGQDSSAANEPAVLNVIALTGTDALGDAKLDSLYLSKMFKGHWPQDKYPSFELSPTSPTVMGSGVVRWEWSAQDLEPGMYELWVNQDGRRWMAMSNLSERLLPSMSRSLYLLPGENELILDLGSERKRRFHFVDAADGQALDIPAAHWRPLALPVGGVPGESRNLSSLESSASTFVGNVPPGEIRVSVIDARVARSASVAVEVLESVIDYEVRLQLMYRLSIAMEPSSTQFHAELEATRFATGGGTELPLSGTTLSSNANGTLRSINFGMPRSGIVEITAPAGWVFADGRNQASIAPADLTPERITGVRFTGLSLRRVIGTTRPNPTPTDD
ncbi:MAG: hypothetical protein ACI9K5_003450 [Gammaproteobacteria bacterium]|jgi:hypothetical protein